MRLHYVRAGRGPLMVFLHGFPEFWYEWKNQLAEFSRDHTVVAPDHARLQPLVETGGACRRTRCRTWSKTCAR